MEITSRPVSTTAKSSGTATTTSERPSDITTKTIISTATCGWVTIWALCTTLVEQSSRADGYLRDEALKKKKMISLFFFLCGFFFLFPHIIFGGRQQNLTHQNFFSPCQPCRVVGHIGESCLWLPIVAYLESIVIAANVYIDPSGYVHQALWYSVIGLAIGVKSPFSRRCCTWNSNQ